MEDYKKFLNPSLFGLILICFLLPFLDISCAGQKASISGLSMVTGGKILGESFDRNILAILAFSVALIGLGISFAKSRTSNLVCTVIGGLGFILTIGLRIAVNYQLDEIPATTEWRIGYYLTLLLFAAAAGYNGYMLSMNQNQTAPRPVTFSPPPKIPKKFCPQCGAPNDPASDFCSQCGRRMSRPPAAAASPEAPVYESPIPYNNVEEASPAPSIDVQDTPAMVEEVPFLVKDEDATQLLQPPVIPALIVNRNGREEKVAITKSEFVIGRNQEAVDYFEANNNNIGRTHAKIVTKEGLYYLVDLDSKNGTFINGNKLTSGVPTPLTFGDQITLANVDYTFGKI